MCHARQRALSADRARFRAVCRSWLLAMRHHGAATRLLPWIVFSDGSFLVPFDDDDGHRPLPTLPENARCIVSTDDWLALDCTDEQKAHTYFLHNPFSDTTVPLPELNAVIGNVSELFEVRKVLMRSGPHDVIAVLTNNWNYPLILVQPGKGVWLPEPQKAPFIYIMDVAFLGGKLYGITHTKDLVYLGIGFDGDGVPNVTSIERLIKCPPSRIYRLHVWRDDDNDNSEVSNDNDGDTDENDMDYIDEELTQEENEEECALDELRDKTGDEKVLEGIAYLKDTDVSHESKDFIMVIWYLVQSRGKLLMVKRHLLVPKEEGINRTRKVEVFEASVRKGVWVPVLNGLGGQALFISKRCCKSISAYAYVEKDTIYFADTGEIFNIKSRTMSKPQRGVDHWQSTWMFSPDLVV
jgi:hypothetical protein